MKDALTCGKGRRERAETAAVEPRIRDNKHHQMPTNTEDLTMTTTLSSTTLSSTTVWSAYEEDGEGELYVDMATAQQGAIALWGKTCRENEEEPNGVYTWAVMKNGGWELLDGRDHTSVYVVECKVHATPVDYTAVRECGCPARIEPHSYGCKES